MDPAHLGVILDSSIVIEAERQRLDVTRFRKHTMLCYRQEVRSPDLQELEPQPPRPKSDSLYGDSTAFSVTATPEPGTFWLLCAAAGMAALCRVRKQTGTPRDQ
jgi:hypothetical protein